jgi:hypothetical protein
MSGEKPGALRGGFMNKSILLLTLFLLFNFSALAQNRFEELTFAFDVLKTKVLPLEPIPFRLTVKNNTGAPATVDTALSFSTNSVTLEIKKPNGKTVAPTQLSYLLGRSISFPKELAPADSIDVNQVFDFKLQTYFGKPGEYQVRATFRNKAGKSIRSGWVPLTVEEPTGTELSAFEYISKKSQRDPGGMLFTSWKPEDLEQLILLHPRSPYADYARYGLGLLYESWQENDKAEGHFRQIQDSTFVHTEDVKERLKKLEHKKNSAN